MARTSKKQQTYNTLLNILQGACSLHKTASQVLRDTPETHDNSDAYEALDTLVDALGCHVEEVGAQASTIDISLSRTVITHFKDMAEAAGYEACNRDVALAHAASMLPTPGAAALPVFDLSPVGAGWFGDKECPVQGCLSPGAGESCPMQGCPRDELSQDDEGVHCTGHVDFDPAPAGEEDGSNE